VAELFSCLAAFEFETIALLREAFLNPDNALGR